MKTKIMTERLELRPFTEEDLEACTAILCDPQIGKTYMVPDFNSRDEAIPLFRRMRELSLADSRFVRAITRNGQMIGWINDCGMEDGALELGYVIAPAYRGNGYMPEALRAAIDMLLHAGFRQVICGHFEENTASRRVMEKAGMHPIDREDSISYRGREHRCLYFAAE